MSRRLVITSVLAGAAVVSALPALAQTLPIYVSTDNGTTVAVTEGGGAGVHVSPDGRVCPLVSTQTWQCVGGVQTSTATPSATQLPAGVGVSTTDGVGVTSSAGSQPLVGAHVSPDGTACATFSYETPQCVGGVVAP